jgi:large subunit ribosomal protein L4
MPKKARQLALRCLLSSKVSEGGLKVLDRFNFEAPKTKEMVKLLDAFKLDSTALIVTAVAEQNVVKSARNIPGVKTLPANILNVIDLLSFKSLVMTEDAVRKAEQLWGKELSQEGTSAAV